jgi:hypothetical protein
MEMKQGAAILRDDEVLVIDAQSMLHVIAAIQSFYDCDRFAIYKTAITYQRLRHKPHRYRRRGRSLLKS